MSILNSDKIIIIFFQAWIKSRATIIRTWVRTSRRTRLPWTPLALMLPMDTAMFRVSRILHTRRRDRLRSWRHSRHRPARLRRKRHPSTGYRHQARTAEHFSNHQDYRVRVYITNPLSRTSCPRLGRILWPTQTAEDPAARGYNPNLDRSLFRKWSITELIQEWWAFSFRQQDIKKSKLKKN